MDAKQYAEAIAAQCEVSRRARTLARRSTLRQAAATVAPSIVAAAQAAPIVIKEMKSL